MLRSFATRSLTLLALSLSSDASMQDPVPTGSVPIAPVAPGRDVRADGAPSFEEVHLRIPNEQPFNMVALGDLDGDGDLDAFCGGGNVPFLDLAGEAFARRVPAVLFNDGSGRLRKRVGGVEALPDVTFDVTLGDLDGDGDLDAYLANEASDRVFRNDGAVFVEAASALPAGVTDGASRTAALADLDGNGILDVYVGRASDVLLLGMPDGSFVDGSSNLPASAIGAHQVSAGDVDADLDVDLLLSGSDGVRLYLNDGNGAFTDASGQLPTTALTYLTLADVNGDLALDALGSDALYLNDGSGVFSDASGQLPMPLVPSNGKVHAFDVDDNGTVDLVAQGANAFYLNDGSGNFTDTGETYLMDAIGDVDGDGDGDLVHLGAGYDFTFWETYSARLSLFDGQGFVGTGALGDWPDSDSTFRDQLAYQGATALVDLDGDGDLDAAVSAPTNGDLFGQRVLRYENDGDGRFDPVGSPDNFPLHGGQVTRILGMDADSDGDNDLILGYLPDADQGPLGGVITYANTPAGFVSPGFIIGSGGSIFDLTAGDVNCDGAPDILQAVDEFEPLPSLATDLLVLGDGAGTFTADPAFPDLPQRSTDGELADADMDGDLDVFLTGDLTLFLRNDDGAWTDLSGTLPFSSAESFEVADLDANGFADALVIDAGEAVLYPDFYTPGAPPRVLMASPDLVDAVVHDTDVDGDLDLFLGLREPIADSSFSMGFRVGYSRHLENDGLATFRSVGRAGFLVRESLAFGDVDDDGDLDASLATRSFRNLRRHLAWSTVPSIGKTLRLDLHGDPSSPWTLFSAAGQAHIPVPSLGILLLDPATTIMEASGTLDPRGRAIFETTIPPVSGLIGSTRYWQAIVDGSPHYTNRETTTLTGL